VHLEASTKSHVHQKIEIFWTTLHPQWPAQTSKKPKKWPQPKIMYTTLTFQISSDQIWVASHFGQPLTSFLLFIALAFL
jgi:hypothetical protein